MSSLYLNYLQKHQPFTDFDAALITNSDLVVVIPVYLEENILLTLDSLKKSGVKETHVAIILVVNASEDSNDDVQSFQMDTLNELKEYAEKFNDNNLSFYPVKAFNLPKKHFGAGLARKIGMDLAVLHFFNTDNEQGIIVSLDADSIVNENYIDEIFKWFNKYPKNNACSIYFEHPLEGEDHSEEIYNAITQYELHLRYYVSALKHIHFPYAFHTIGSCFAARANAYVKVGGMNRRQGGEEFYFIQKLFQLGGYGELTSTTIHPSPRISNRVPFGTGPSIKNIVDNQGEYLTYNPIAFFDLKILFDSVEKYYLITEEEYQKQILELPGRVRSFLLNSEFWEEINTLSGNCSGVDVFRKRFYNIFNAFKIVKYLNYIHEHFIDKIPVFDAAIELLESMQYSTEEFFDEQELLLMYRDIQKKA